MDLSKTLGNYIEELSSSSPTPGGGNVAALCGVLATSLGSMVCALTIGKKKYTDVEEEMKSIQGALKNLQDDFLSLAKKDNEAFDKVMEAFKLPKETEEQKNARRNEIDNATLNAAIVPAEVIAKCKQILPYLASVAEKGNQNSISDAGVALSLISTAAQGAFLNVVINCSGLLNRVTAEEFLKRSEIPYREVKRECDNLITSMIDKMNAS